MVWEQDGAAVRVDGTILALQADADGGPTPGQAVSAVVATSLGQVSLVELGQGPGGSAPLCLPLVCGHASAVTAVVQDLHGGGMLASCTQGGALRLWRLVDDGSEVCGLVGGWVGGWCVGGVSK